MKLQNLPLNKDCLGLEQATFVNNLLKGKRLNKKILVHALSAHTG